MELDQQLQPRYYTSDTLLVQRDHWPIPSTNETLRTADSQQPQVSRSSPTTLHTGYRVFLPPAPSSS